MSEKFYLNSEAVGEKPYHYRACGLDGIFLLNGYNVEDYDGEEFVSITDVDGLHRAIGRHLVLHRKALSPKELRFLRNTMDLTQSELAEILGNNSQSVARWEKGECEIPGAAEKLLRAVYLATLLTNEELAALKQLLMKRLTELDESDEVSPTPAQFELFDRWTEKYDRRAA